MATHSSILAWRIPWTEKTGGLQSMGLQSVRHDWVTNTFTFHLPNQELGFSMLKFLLKCLRNLFSHYLWYYFYKLLIKWLKNIKAQKKILWRQMVNIDNYSWYTKWQVLSKPCCYYHSHHTEFNRVLDLPWERNHIPCSRNNKDSWAPAGLRYPVTTYSKKMCLVGDPTVVHKRPIWGPDVAIHRWTFFLECVWLGAKPAKMHHSQRAALKYIHYPRELSLVLCDSLELGDRAGGGREVQEGGDMCIPMADSCWCMAESSTTL